MATISYFEKTIVDLENKSVAMKLEFGRTSFYGGKDRMYLNMNDNSVCVDEATGREIFEAMKLLGTYLGY